MTREDRQTRRMEALADIRRYMPNAETRQEIGEWADTDLPHAMACLDQLEVGDTATAAWCHRAILRTVADAAEQTGYFCTIVPPALVSALIEYMNEHGYEFEDGDWRPELPEAQPATADRTPNG